MSNPKLWGGRFGEATDSLVESFTESVSFDRALYLQDIRGSMAHARMLARVGVLDETERDAIIDGLADIREDIEKGRFSWSQEMEDLHMNIESELIRRIGVTGKKLHTGRSRNDQIATDLRLYVRDVIDDTLGKLGDLQTALLALAERETETIMPGYTHLQAAQPVTLGHHVLAWVEMLERDSERLIHARSRVNRLPLGSAALAGTTFPIDRESVARELGFDGLCENSIDAVSDRDFVIEFLSVGALVMVHLSRVSEELVLWQSQAYGFIEIGDAFCTGSSIMPQKKNPDIAELIRGKSGRGIGNLVALMTLMKGQPLAYNRDNQEDKEPLFDTARTLSQVLAVLAAMVPAIAVNRPRMREAATQGYTTATDLADYLVQKGVPFRDAHEIVGRAVAECVSRDIALQELELEQLKAIDSRVEGDVYDVLSLEGSVSARDHPGGTAPRRVRAAIEKHRRRLNEQN